MSIVYIRFAGGGLGPLQRSPLLERLIARATAAVPVLDWRADAFRLIAPPGTLPPVAAVALHGVAEAVAGAWVCVATPVHLTAGMSSVAMSEEGGLALSPAEAAALAADFNRVFAGAGMRLARGHAALLLCLCDEVLEVLTSDPEAVAGRDVFSSQPTGPDAPRLRRLMSEMEMWLFDHEVNRARMAQNRQAITGLWLWGGGVRSPGLPPVTGWTAGQDPFFAAFGAQARLPSEAGSGVVVCPEYPGSSGWPEVEQRWLSPALSALQSGELQRLDLSAAERCFSVGRGPQWRFWRRPKSWWESFGVIAHGIQ